MKNEITKQYLSNGKNLMPLNGKRPIKQNWTELKLSADEVLAHKGNKGWILGASDLIIDVDKQNGGLASYEKLVADLNLDLEPTVNTPSGGHHVYLSIPDDWQGKAFHKTLNAKYAGIDFLTKGSQAVIVGSSTDKGEYVWSDDLFGEFVQTPAPVSLLREISYEHDVITDTNSNDEMGDFAGLIGGKSATWAEEDVLKLLAKIDPSLSNDEWVKVGQSLHDWSPVDGLAIWEKWSQGGDNYDEGETAKRWKGFKIGKGVTLGTLSYMAKKFDKITSIEAASTLLKEINNADEMVFRTDIVPKIKKANLDKFDFDKLVKAYQDKAKEFTGVKPAIAEVRRDLSPNDKRPAWEIDIDDRPSWTHRWVYVGEIDVFINSEKLVPMSINAFNMINGRFVPYGDGGSKPSANKYVSDKGLITVVDSMAYLPTHDDFICDMGKQVVVNTFNHASVPAEADNFTDEGLAAIERVKAHIKFICTSDENTEILTQWFAHQVQYMGKQILWSPVIQGIEGVGKSFLGDLMRTCLGDKNVGTVGSEQVTSSFNGWATNVIVNVLEELHIAGKNRHVSVNTLKPLITDRMIQINDKGVKQYSTYNTTNYICFTNFKDSLPLNATDRRWWVVFVPLDSMDNLHEYVGESKNTYYPKLFDAMRKHGTEIRKWLLEYPITAEFMNTKQAPMTDDKLSMIATEESALEGLNEVKDMLETGGKYWNKECVCPADLFQQLSFDNPDIEVSVRERSIILKKLGFSALPKVIRFDGKVRRWWSKRTMTSDQLRASLDKYNSGEVKSVEDYFTD